MTNIHLVRIDSCGTVGRYVVGDLLPIRRGMRVVCRTQRGMEAGEVLACLPPLASREGIDEYVDGDLVRCLSPQDQAQLDYLARQRGKAIDMCQELLDQTATPATVVDAVYPLDGQWIGFYVLGPAAPAMNDVARQVATEFHVSVQFLSATDDDEAGSCGAGGCRDGGCSTGGCATCPAADACQK